MSAQTLKLIEAQNHDQGALSAVGKQDEPRLADGQGNAHLREYPEWMDLKTITRYAAISERTVREWLHRAVKPLPAVRVGTKILVRRSTFDHWLNAHPLAPADSIDIEATTEQIIAELAG